MAHIEGPAIEEAKVAAAVVSARPGYGAFGLGLGAPWGSIEYRLTGNRLTVISGAGGEESALYIFAGRDGIRDLELMGACPLERWSASCVASPTGRGYLAWDPELALAAFLRKVEGQGANPRDVKRIYGPPQLGTPAEWADWLNLHGWVLFGPDGGDLSTIGYRPSNALRLHCFALRAGLPRLRGAA